MEQKPYIIIAEDDFEDRYVMSETFSELGYAGVIKMVEDGIYLVDYLKEASAGAVKLIVLDLNMPRLNGTETLRALKGHPEYRHIPVIIFSTSINEIEKDICMDLGATEYITKPTKYMEYIETCRKFYSLAQ